ncbi:MAG: DUF1631 domain-containing protein [Burkholderiaceae bacterium]|nr:DUF1631 domain-containing protein [Burkholderiaceae bacterium]MEB2319863.1 DUF1631 family protein [Pseudomonadota bacterium]
MTADSSTSPSRIFADIRAELARELTQGFRGLLPVLAAELEAAGERAESDRDCQALLAACSTLRVDPDRRAARIAGVFEDLVRRVLKAAELDDPSAQAEALALMDEETLEAQLIAQPLAKTVREADPSGYETFAARIRRISPVPWADDALNPVGARVLAQAIVGSLADILESGPVRKRLRSLLPPRVAPMLGQLVAGAERRMARLGVEPMPPSQALPTAADPCGDPPAADVGSVEPAAGKGGRGDGQPPEAPEPSASDRIVDRVARADGDARRLGTSALASLAADDRLRVLPTLQPVVDIERDAVAFAHSIGEVPYSRTSRSRYFANVRKRLGEASATPPQLAVVDVVAAMFDYVVDDRRLPQAAHPLVWRLQQPALALALLDPGYLGDEPRSLRRLVENFGAIANAFADDLTRGSELYRRMETVVRAVEIVTSALQTRSAVMSRQVELEYSRAAGHVSQLIERIVRERSALESMPGRRNRRDYTRRPNRGQEREVTERIERLLEERIARHSVPESVHEFLRKVWLRHLRTAVLRDGEDSGEFRVALQVVDDLLWSLDDKGPGQVSRRELVQRIPPLIQVLTQGLRAIGAREEEHRGFFDELFLIHLRRLQRRDRSATASGPVEARGDEVSSGPAESADDADPAPTTRMRPTRTQDSHTTTYDVQGSVPTLRDPLQARERVGDRQVAEAADAVASTVGDEDDGDAPGTRVRMTNGTGQSDATHSPGEHAEIPPVVAVPIVDATPGVHSREEAVGEADERSHRLLEVLNAVDLADLPGQPRRILLDPDEAFGQLSRGDWVEMESRDGGQRYMKVAWINRKRTVALLVRHPDRRALSLRMNEMARRFEAGRAFLLERTAH